MHAGEAVERRPRRPNGYVGRVFPLLKAGQPRSVIESATGLHGARLTEAIRGNFRLGLLDPLTAQERHRQHRANTSAAKGGVFLCVQPYWDLDLTARQTQVALRVDDGKTFLLRQISSAYAREMHRHGLIRPIRELTVEAQRDKRRTDETLLRIVHTRQQAQAFLRTRGLPKPTSLRGWAEIEARLDEPEEESILRAILPASLPLPQQRSHMRFLIELHEKLAVYRADGTRSLVYDPFRHLASDNDPYETLRCLRPQIQALQQRFGLRDPEMLRLLRDD